MTDHTLAASLTPAMREALLETVSVGAFQMAPVRPEGVAELVALGLVQPMVPLTVLGLSLQFDLKGEE